MSARGATGPGGRGAQLGYRPALDGLRALSVLAVMLYHADIGWLSGGFLGVDVFFVLSGFLITSLLVREWSTTSALDLTAFWMRRGRRLLPGLFVVLIAVALYCVALPDASQPGIRGDALATLAYVSNWWFMTSDQSYFAQFLEPSALRHTWSLAIEEQFYLVFPLLLTAWLVRARASLQGLRWLLLAGVAASALLMSATHEAMADPSRAYYGTDTRLQAILLGAVLALSPRLTRPASPVHIQVGGRILPLPISSAAGWAALTGLLAMTLWARELSTWMYQGGFLLAATLAAVVVAAAGQAPRGSFGRALSMRPLVAVGLVSYGLYLWHWPVYVVLNPDRTGLSGVALLVVRVAATALLATLSFRFVEEPIRSRRLQARLTITQWRRTIAGATAAVLVTLVGATATAAGPAAAPGGVSAGAGSQPVVDAQGRTVFLLGDSQAYGLHQYFGNRVPGLLVTGSTQLGCGTLLPQRVVDGDVMPNEPYCTGWEPRWTRELLAEQPDLVLLMLGVGELYDRFVAGDVITFGTDAYRAWLFDEIDRRRDIAGPSSGGFALATVMCMKVKAGAERRIAELANDPARLGWLNATIRSYGAEHPDVPIVDLHASVCSDGYADMVDGVDLRSDGLHLTDTGAALVWDKVGPAVRRLAEQVSAPDPR